MYDIYIIIMYDDYKKKCRQSISTSKYNQQLVSTDKFRCKEPRYRIYWLREKKSKRVTGDPGDFMGQFQKISIFILACIFLILLEGTYKQSCGLGYRFGGFGRTRTRWPNLTESPSPVKILSDNTYSSFVLFALYFYLI